MVAMNKVYYLKFKKKGSLLDNWLVFHSFVCVRSCIFIFRLDI